MSSVAKVLLGHSYSETPERVRSTGQDDASGTSATARRHDSPVRQLYQADRLGGLSVASPSQPDGQPVAWDRFGLFLLLAEAVEAGAFHEQCLLAIDPSPNAFTGIVPLMRSVMAVQEALVKAASVDFGAMRKAVSEAESDAEVDRIVADMLVAGYEADVTEQLQRERAQLGVAEDPVAAYDNACRSRHVLMERNAALQRVGERLASKRPKRRAASRGHVEPSVAHIGDSVAG